MLTEYAITLHAKEKPAHVFALRFDWLTRLLSSYVITQCYINVMLTLYGLGLLFTHKNGDFSAVSVTERSHTVPIFKVESHIWVRFLPHSLG